MVDDPRLSCWCREGDPLPHPACATIRDALAERYAAPFGAVGLNYYRDGNDSVAPHADRELRELDDTLIAIVTLGARRPFLIRPKGGGPSLDVAPASGDLLVMGGACQARLGARRAEGRAAGPRVSATWRWACDRRHPRRTGVSSTRTARRTDATSICRSDGALRFGGAVVVVVLVVLVVVVVVVDGGSVVVVGSVSVGCSGCCTASDSGATVTTVGAGRGADVVLGAGGGGASVVVVGGSVVVVVGRLTSGTGVGARTSSVVVVTRSLLTRTWSLPSSGPDATATVAITTNRTPTTTSNAARRRRRRDGDDGGRLRRGLAGPAGLGLGDVGLGEQHGLVVHLAVPPAGRTTARWGRRQRGPAARRRTS